jgi:hypothetical protein
MIPTVAPNIARDATNGIIISSPSMKGLLLIISTVPGLLSPKCRPGAVGSHYLGLAILFTCKSMLFTLVNSNTLKTISGTLNDGLKYKALTRPGVCSGSGPASTSGKCRDNAWPGPAESVFPVSCRRSVRDKALKERYPASWPAWRWSAFPVALSCKAPTEVSFLLY